MTILKKIARSLFARFVVVATFDGQVAKHKALSFAEALEWARCYPARDKVEVYELVSGIPAIVPVAARALV